MAYIICFLNGRHLVKHLFLEHAVACIGVDGEVANTKRGEVLEEMRTLRGVDMVVLQTCLHNDTGSRDMWPLHGDT